jgi:serine phosphatase RsbU (regulator of sigma subunit)
MCGAPRQAIIVSPTSIDRRGICQPGAGDGIALFTDGVTEAGPRPEAFFERSGVEAAARDLWSLDASAIGDGSFDAVLRHAEGHVNDDATIVVVKLTGIANEFD